MTLEPLQYLWQGPTSLCELLPLSMPPTLSTVSTLPVQHYVHLNVPTRLYHQWPVIYPIKWSGVSYNVELLFSRVSTIASSECDKYKMLLEQLITKIMYSWWRLWCILCNNWESNTEPQVNGRFMHRRNHGCLCFIVGDSFENNKGTKVVPPERCVHIHQLDENFWKIND